MNEWIRLECAYWQHVKARRLRKILGPEADVYPVRLWCWCAIYAPDGRPKQTDIELACEWTGADGRLLDALVQTGILDPDFAVHGWMERSGGSIADIHRKRADDAQRKRDVRAISSGHPADIQRTAQPVQECPRLEESRVEERREEKLPPPPSPSAPERPKRTKRVPSPDLDFEAFYQAYPWKSKPLDAEKAWEQTKARRPPLAGLLVSLEAHKTSWDWTKDGGKWIPLPASWLRAGGWASIPRPEPPPDPSKPF